MHSVCAGAVGGGRAGGVGAAPSVSLDASGSVARTHATLHGAPTAAGTCCLWDCDENFDAHDTFAGIRLQLETMLFEGTGDTINDLRVREDLRIRINAFYRRADGTVNMERKDNEA